MTLAATRSATDEIALKADRLIRNSDKQRRDIGRIRSIIDGGAQGLRAVLGDAGKQLGEDLPAPNLILSGLERMSQKVGRVPTTSVPPIIVRGSDAQIARDRADKLERINTGFDVHQRLELQLLRQGRWLPGYGFHLWVLHPKDGTFVGQIRDPFDSYPGFWTPDQPPMELAVRRLIDIPMLKEIYPQLDMDVEGHFDQKTEVVEYYDKRGTWVIATQTKQVLDFIDSPIDDTPFVFGARPTLGNMQGQYDQTIGLLSMMTRLNVLTLQSVQDDVNAPVEIIGDIESGEYKRGRFAVNKYSPGTTVQRGRQSNTQPGNIQADRLERQLRLAAGYPVQDDSISPNSFVTGAGLAELGQSGSAIVREYHVVLARALEELDAKRLKANHLVWGDTERNIVAVDEEGSPFVETYVPNEDINGHYLTVRNYGVMAGWDEPTKIVTGLQLMQARIIDRQTLQENLDNLSDIGRVNNRIFSDRAEDALFLSLETAAGQGDLNAASLLNQIRKDPEKMSNILDDFFEAQEQQQPQGAPQAGGPTPDVTTVLSRLEQGGGIAGGVQSVGTL